MTTKISHKIVGFNIKKPEEKSESAPIRQAAKEDGGCLPAASQAPAQPSLPGLEFFHEKLERPEVLIGSTYKIRTPLSEHSLYITINDIILNQGTPHEIRRPFELFINSKNMDHFQWIVALTRVMSAVFRKGGDITFLVEELHSVFDPKGGYMKRGGRYVPSLVAEIGDVIEAHLQMIGMIPPREMSPAQREFLEHKRQEFEDAQKQEMATAAGGFPAGATLCGKCHVKAVVRIDNCATCLNCGDSKCG
jgi:hypothetical protein